MAKPKFTPDPPPYLQNMPAEEAFPLFVDWVIRQEYRKEDWWPKDYEERIQALEQLVPYCTGTWPIVDYSNITFESVAEIIDGATGCDVSWALTDTTGSWATNNHLNGGISLERDNTWMLVGLYTGEGVTRWQDSGGWTYIGSVSLPPVTYTGFGRDVAHSTSAGLMVVGAPQTAEVGSATGSAFIYSGSNSGGWVYQNELTDPGPLLRARFGWSVEISEDGSVVAVGAPGTPSLQATQRVCIYDRVGSSSSFTHRQTLTQSGSDIGFGHSVALNPDGSVLIVGDATHGTDEGEVTVWDDVSGTFTLRQTIPQIDLLSEGIPGSALGGTGLRFGSDVSLSEDSRSLFVKANNYTSGGGVAQGLVVIYELNSSTNNYDYCSYFVGTASANDAMDVVFSESVKTVAISQQIFATSQGRVDFYE